MDTVENERPTATSAKSTTSQKSLPPLPFDTEDTYHVKKTPEKSSPNALRELDILLRDSTPDVELDKPVRPHFQ